jgi:tRNA nucleotidyltransferase/poly(A) polymerase
MTRRLDPSREIWMHASETRAVMAALLASGGDARFVGGAVRNALLNCEVGDVDIATPLVPAEVTRRFENAGITAVPTGIAHGTITAITGGKAFEVTTLRRDVSFRTIGPKTLAAAISRSTRSMPRLTGKCSTSTVASPISMRAVCASSAKRRLESVKTICGS